MVMEKSMSVYYVNTTSEKSDMTVMKRQKPEREVLKNLVNKFNELRKSQTQQPQKGGGESEKKK